MEKRKVIVWFDDDAERYRLLMQDVENAGYEVHYIHDLRKSFKIAKDGRNFTDCVLIVMEPVHLHGIEGVPKPKSLISYIRNYAQCKAPIIFLTMSDEDKKMLREFAGYGVVKILKKGKTFPRDLKREVEEVLNKSK